MTSEAKIAANRRNAKKSTGPRSAAGKTRVRRNAFRHGLAIPIRHDVATAMQIAPLMAAFGAGDDDPCRQDAARMAAESQLDIQRVREAKVDLLNRAARDCSAADAACLSDEERASLAFERKSNTLLAFDRYERRAHSRRKRALRQLTVCADFRIEHSGSVPCPSDLSRADPARPNAPPQRDGMAPEQLGGEPAKLQSGEQDRVQPSEPEVERSAAYSLEKRLLLEALVRERERRRKLQRQRTDADFATLCRRGDTLAGKGKLKEALAVHRRNFNLRNAQVVHGSGSPVAEEQLGSTVDRIGDLAQKFLLIGDFERARRCAEHALAYFPDSFERNLDLGLALMLLGRVDEARTTFLKYRRQKTPRGSSCERAIVRGFARMRKARYSHRLMEEITKAFAVGQEPEQQSNEVDQPEHAVEQAPTPAPTPERANITSGDKLVKRGELDQALVAYRRGLVASQAKIAQDGSNAQAQDDYNLGIGRIGDLAFEFLKTRRLAEARGAIKEAISYAPDCLRFQLTCAHALMLSAMITGAMNVHRAYHGRTLESGESWGAAIRGDFAVLRAVGVTHPTVMAEIERQFARDP